MGLETLIYYAVVGGEAWAVGSEVQKATGKASKIRMPLLLPLKTPGVGITKEKDRAKAYLASRTKRAGSRRASQVTVPGFLLDPAQIRRPSLSNVLG